MTSVTQIGKRHLGSYRWLVSGLLGLGLGLVVAGIAAGARRDAVLLELGVALGLGAALLFVEQLVEKSIENVRRELTELGKATAERIAAAREADADIVRAFRDDVTVPNVLRALRRAHDLDAVDARGVRVRLPDATLWLRFTPSSLHDAIHLTVEACDGGQPLGSEDWSDGEPVEQALELLAQALQKAGAYRGVESFNERTIFENLAETLEVVLSLRTGGANLAPVVEVAGEWAITSKGLEHVEDRELIVLAEPLTSQPTRERENLLARANSRLGSFRADGSLLLEAFDTAVEYHRGMDRDVAMGLLGSS
jgi:hypothetical protein